jgi:glycosyltransferase involved in cell wall biosynthesis
MTVCVHTLIQNEERYIWFSIMSVINYVDRIMVWDTGSEDSTIEIINSLKRKYPSKIEVKEVGKVDGNGFTETRNQMLKETHEDWLLILDGDEVWWEDSIKEISNVMKNNAFLYDSIVSKYINLVGDIYHYQDEKAGRYKIKDLTGFITIRAMNKKKIKGLKIEKPHGQQGFYDNNNNLIQDRPKENMYFTDKPSFMHFTNLLRSRSRAFDRSVPKRDFKLKYEIGKSFTLDYYYPEVFFNKRPDLVDSVWRRMDRSFYLRSILETPARKLKRKIFLAKSGY